MVEVAYPEPLAGDVAPPVARFLQTGDLAGVEKRVARVGATTGLGPTAPARYSVAKSGVINALNITKKNNAAIPYIVKGLMSQFVIHVTNSPFGFFPTFLIL